MKTYQDLLAVGAEEKDRMQFCLSAIAEHQSGEQYRIAMDAEAYYRNENPTIMRLQKFIRNAMGESIPDTFSPNNKIPANLYHYFVTQEVQTLLGNGASFAKDDTKKKLGKKFDRKLVDAARCAINAGSSFGFWNNGNIEVFSYLEFVPLYDEFTGQLMAGIRFWQIDESKPLCVVLFEVDGVTEYVREKGKDISVKRPKRAYKTRYATSKADGEYVLSAMNYETFPIVPLYNENRQSAIVGKQNTLDSYDLTLSQMVNNVDDGNFIYWILKNCGGMDAVDDERFISQLKITHMAHADGDSGSGVEGHVVEAPYQANSVTLDKLRNQLFDDFMALDTKNIASGAATATQIEAAYEPLNNKCDQLEYCVIDFVDGILALAGIDDYVTFTRSKIVNVSDEISTLVESASYLDTQYIVQKILMLLGDGDKFTEVMSRLVDEDTQRFSGEAREETDEGSEQSEEAEE